MVTASVGLAGTLGLRGLLFTSLMILSVSILAAVLGSFTASDVPTLLRLGRLSVVVGVLSSAVIGLFDLLGPACLLVVGVLAITAPTVRERLHVWRILARGTPAWARGPFTSRPTDTPAPEHPAARPDPDPDRRPPLGGAGNPDRPDAGAGPWTSPVDLGTLDDAELCLAWRRSFLRLQQAHSVHSRLAVVVLRERCLDELQRRNPSGVSRWLASGARAAGNPLPYLHDHHH